MSTIHARASLGVLLCAAGCGGVHVPETRTEETRAEESASHHGAEAAVCAVLDAWHDAAARSDEAAYFALMTHDAIFLGTDATERWSRDELRAYAHGPFSEGRGWRMRAVRRAVVLGPGAVTAWFDEDLETVNLGPARGSGVLVHDGSAWRIAQYNLAITVPNERFGEVRALLGAPAADEPPR
jgi:uncharacterized protein (TIGR02246 family)